MLKSLQPAENQGTFPDSDQVVHHSRTTTSLLHKLEVRQSRNQERDIGENTPNALNAKAERPAIWPCLNVATWRRERSDRAIQQKC